MSADSGRLVTSTRVPSRVVARVERRLATWRLTLICGHVVERPMRDDVSPRLVSCYACKVRESHTVSEWASGLGQVPLPWQRQTRVSS